jgi:hypothetical protein
MDLAVDQAGGPGATRRATSTQNRAEQDEIGSEDIESELYSSTREAGVSAAAFSALADDD